MKRIGLLIVCLAGLIFILPLSPAQEKKDPDKIEKKDDAKDPEKKDDEKKKTDAPVKKPIEKMPAHGAVVRTKIVSASAASGREFTVEMQEVDPKKVQDLNNWKAQQANTLGQKQFQVSIAKDFKARITAQQNYQQALATYNYELAKRSNNIYTAKNVEVRATDDAKVRTMFLPLTYDDEGNPKKWTDKEKKELRGNTQMPGYPSDFDAIRTGQYVELYMYKKPPPPKGEKVEPKKKRGPDDDPVEVKTTPEFVLMVILAEGK